MANEADLREADRLAACSSSAFAVRDDLLFGAQGSVAPRLALVVDDLPPST